MSQELRQHSQELIRLLTTAAASAALYHPEHRQVTRLAKRALAQLQQLFLLEETITFKVIDDQLIVANHPLGKNLAVQRLLTALIDKDIGYLSLEPGIYAEELLGLVLILSKAPDQQAEIRDSEHIHFGQIEVRQRHSAGAQSGGLGLEQIAACESDRLLDICETARNRQPLDTDGIEEIVSSFISAFDSQSDAFLALAPLRAMDEYSYTHSTNICLLNLAQARSLGFSGQLLKEIGIAALLHDVGKMFIPSEILSKAGQLSAEEWRIMQQHPRLGAEYLINTPGVPRLAAITAFEHHMGYDRQGYPQTQGNWQPHLCSFMTAVSDTYDAMRTSRSYEESLDQNRITTIMLDLAGNKLHPQLTYNFLQQLNQLEQFSS
jgi:HD-GYP domain-containing protein (c-di-GMP phosphodiesterase class II)